MKQIKLWERLKVDIRAKVADVYVAKSTDFQEEVQLALKEQNAETVVVIVFSDLL